MMEPCKTLDVVIGGDAMVKSKKTTKNPLGQLELIDVIRSLVTYDVMHQAIPQFKGRLYGMVSFDEKTVYLDTKQDYMEMLDTVVHEFYHLKAKQDMVDPTEEQVDEMAKQTVKHLFGRK